MGEGHTPAPAGGMREVDVPDWLDPSWGSVVTSWTRFSDWLSELEQRGVSPNVASFVGGGTLREHVCGYRRGETTGSERSRMRDLLAQSLSDGALGVAYALIYPPDAYATTDELTEVCQALQRGGIYISHV
ncbi:MAG TPA: hypothetical protein VMU66_01555, partial [Gaiellales bacterium]|nr:hypothetical protein [Gaiellales bacterium]